MEDDGKSHCDFDDDVRCEEACFLMISPLVFLVVFLAHVCFCRLFCCRRRRRRHRRRRHHRRHRRRRRRRHRNF